VFIATQLNSTRRRVELCRCRRVSIATQLNSTQLTQLNSVQPSQSCFCLWRHNLQTESTGSLRSLIGDSCSRCERVDNSTSSWVELCRYKHLLKHLITDGIILLCIVSSLCCHPRSDSVASWYVFSLVRVWVSQWVCVSTLELFKKSSWNFYGSKVLSEARTSSERLQPEALRRKSVELTSQTFQIILILNITNHSDFCMTCCCCRPHGHRDDPWVTYSS